MMTTIPASPTIIQTRRRPLRPAVTMALRYVPLLILVFFFTFPLVFMIVSSFKTSNVQIFSDLRSVRAFLPAGELTLDNFQRVFTDSNFPRYIINSLAISAVTIVLALAVNSMAAYALSRLKWRGQQLILSLIIATLIIPGQAAVMPLLLLVSRLPTLSFEEGISLAQGWLDTYHVQIIPFIASAFSIFLFYQFFQEIPKELDEAALVDGASRFQIFYRIIVPISGPVFASVAILTFIGSWNAFLWPIMTIQSDELRPVMVGLQFFFQRDVQWGEVMAYTTMITLPVLAFFFAFQSAFVKSIATSGIKG
ncbi:MAG: carbohydrate ABC transporter permease [Chloroflexi bacterium]|nr:carbohydrate ABC transporter permease [Chloroflexota bacterium]MCI0575751.1 carbohydrate ABC transporter permease [Chloroflexota bacterium]MCI0643642.1 carbohydrate ABC transporter permease [Chloroflexota bacterium]MCI0729817.1 carbohydrate ABC transporter permease [Chloroflexota bacterium]